MNLDRATNLGVNIPFQKKQKNNNWNIKLKNYMFENHIPDWIFGYTNAKLVFQFYAIFSDIFSMLTYFGFEGDLCLFKDTEDIKENELELTNNDLKNYNFFKSNLSQKQYFNKYIGKNMSYIKFVQSSFFMCLNTSFKNKNRSDFIFLIEKFCDSLLCNVNTVTNEILFQDLLNLDIFYHFPLECIQGFTETLKDPILLSSLKVNNFERIEKEYRISRCLEAFPFYFSKEFSLECIQDCTILNSVAPLLLAFKVYEIKLIIQYKPLWKKNCHQDFVFFQQFIINNKYLSKQNLDLLLKKNNNFYNYE